MKFERTKNATRNIIFGCLNNVYLLIIPFVNRTIIIHVMGIQYLGLNSLFSSILSVLNLAELGVGAALTYSMYKPVAENDTVKICALMNLYKKYYRIIGAVIGVIGIILCPFIPNLVKNDLPEGLNLYVLYLMNLFTTVFTYWLFAYKNSLLIVFQRNDISTKISMLVTTVTYFMQWSVLFLYKNYYIYLVVMLGAQVLHNILIAIIVDKRYPDYKPFGMIEKNEVKIINQRVRDMFTSKIGGTIVDSADTLVISYFLGLSVLGIYNNYFYLMVSIKKFISTGLTSIISGIGNSIVVETKEKNYNDLRRFSLIVAWVSGFCSCCFLCLFQPFIKLWLGEKFQLSYSIVILIVIYFYVMEINQLLSIFREASGAWHNDRFRPLVTALSNLAMNVAMVQFWGLHGVLLSTVLSTVFISMPWSLKNLFTCVFNKQDFKKYTLLIFTYTLAVCIAGAICAFLSNYIFFPSLIITIIVRVLVCFAVSNGLFFLLFHKTKEFSGVLSLINSITKGKVKFLSRMEK